MQGGKHVILCIDDDQDILASLKVVLESDGYLVATAANAAEARQAYEQARPDVLIVDLMMEEVDAGLKFVAQVRATGDPVPIYFLSSTGDYLYGAADMQAIGADGVFQKPIAPQVLLTLLRARLANRPARPAGTAASPA
jgi:DNA-binding response OmpR family regulator